MPNACQNSKRNWNTLIIKYIQRRKKYKTAEPTFPFWKSSSILKGYLVLTEYGILNEIEGKRMKLKEKEAEKDTEK